MPFVLAVLAALLLAAPALGSGGTVLCLDPGASRADAERIAAAAGGVVVDSIPALDAYLVAGLGRGAERSLAAASLVRAIEPNRTDQLAASPPYRGSDWHLQAVRVPEAWATTRGSPSVTVAILDTGVDIDRDELAGRVVPGTDVANDDDDPRDRNGHGTFVAGIVASDGFVTGVCPACSVMPVKVVEDGSTEATKFDSADGIVWAVDHGADVLNLSLGGADRSQVQEDAVRYALARGVVIVASAGNEGTATPQYPAGYDGVVGVGGTDDRDRSWSGSSYGAWVDLAAPATQLFSLSLAGGIERRSGTSYSTPIVSGVAALVLAAHPALSGDAVADALRAGTVPTGDAERRYDRGRIDAVLALAKASSPGEETLSVTRFALSPLAPFLTRYPEPRAGNVFAAGAVVLRDDTGELVDEGEVACVAHVGSRVLPVVARRLRDGVAICAWRVPWAAGARWVDGWVIVRRNGYQAMQPFRVKARKPLRP